jgi:hypothetical protein
MPRIATRHAHQLAYRQRFSVGVRMFGCLLLIAGSIVLAATVVKARQRSISDTRWLTVSICLVVAACGAVFLWGEHGKRIDREHKAVTRWWGVGRPLWRRTRDMQPYQAVVVERCEDASVTRWRVSLFGDPAERLELFDLPSHHVAQAVARQVAAFLSLTILLPGTAPAAAVLTQAPAPPPASDRWIHWRAGRRSFRFLGVVLLSLATVLLLGVVASAISHRPWLIWLAIAAPLFVVGSSLLCGGHKIEIDRQSVRVWRAWPLPPSVYDLSAFYAIIIAPTSSEGEPETCLVGLIGPEQLRLELVDALSAEEARETGGRLAATTSLPLVDESQPAVPSGGRPS